MYIQIDKIEEIPDDFLVWLKDRIYIEGMSYLNQNKQRLKAFDRYFDQIFVSPRKITAVNTIVSGLKNIVIEKVQGGIHIYINRNVKIPMTRNITLHSLCMLIDQGNVELQPFPIFTYVTNKVKDNLVSLFTQYVYGVL